MKGVVGVLGASKTLVKNSYTSPPPSISEFGDL